MWQQKEHENRPPKAWAEPLDLSYKRPSERAKKGQHSTPEADINPGTKLAGLRLNKKEEVEARTDNQTESQTEIDVEAVARKVYRLMQVDLILENERTR